MSSQQIWCPSKSNIDSSNLTRFARSIGHEPLDFPALHKWSVTNRAAFWEEAWSFLDVIGDRGTQTLEREGDFLESRWFSDSSLNYAENLTKRNDDAPAIVGILETGDVRRVSFSELRTKVGQFAAELRDRGLGKGDRIAAFLPNVFETVVAMLGTASIGAVWSSCSPDFGLHGALDRFGQIAPKLLISTDGYWYNGKIFRVEDTARQLAHQVDSIEEVFWLRLLGDLEDDFDTTWQRDETLPEFERFPFDHPLFIMFSSGTTGKPKCIVHGAGGTLLQHLKEHQLHVDLGPSSRLFFYTTCGWMMWNWLVSALASGTTIVLYDGSPFYPDSYRLLNMIETESIGYFGAGAKYYSSLQNSGVKADSNESLRSLKTILSTGSPLLPETFDYIYSQLKSDVNLASISGGTDLISCFVLGNPWSPVYRGEIQGPGLGMDVTVFNESGNPVQGQKGELVCTKSFPSKPIGFWNDRDHEKYRSSYFSVFNNVWAHRDFAEINPESGGYIIHGRSDSVLNPGGVRIGTAEIYRQVESMGEIEEALCIGQVWEDDTRIVLFIVVAEASCFSEDLVKKVKLQVRRNASPKHVPSVVLQVSDLPRTRSGKIAEIAVRDIVHGKRIANTSALENPEILDEFRNRPELTANKN